MKQRAQVVALATLFVLALSALASAALFVPAGTPVTLVFDQSLNSKTAQVGQAVRLHVANSVMIGSRVILRGGMPVTGVLTRVNKRKAYGVNADIRIALNPIQTRGGIISIEPRTKGGSIGNKTGQAAGATAGGAIVLGPVGLLGGYFVHGKSVMVRPGDILETEVSRDTSLRLR
jgi:hypothetical protein